MPRDERIFSHVFNPPQGIGHRQGRSVVMTVMLETAAVAALIVVPLLAVEVLPAPTLGIAAFVAPPAPPPPPPAPPPPRPPQQPEAPAPAPVPLEAPDIIGPEPPPIVEGPPALGPLVAATGTVPVGIAGGDPEAHVAPPPPPPAARRPEPVGGRIRPPQKTTHVPPRYPPLALAARVQGLVIIEAVIDETGRVSSARVLRGHPLLDAEALHAVQQWRFTPTLLNGVPTAVIMTVTVEFTLK